MTRIDVRTARKALKALPEGTRHGEAPSIKQVYLPQSHMKAIDPDAPLVIGMRGAGKTFWWSALRDPSVRRLIERSDKRLGVGADTEIRTGFGVTPDPEKYPDKYVLRELMEKEKPGLIWRTVLARHISPEDHPLQRKETWTERVTYVADNPEEISHLFHERDGELDQKNTHFMILFDALDRCADEWRHMYAAIEGLLQNALEMRSYRRLRVKVFLRSDQLDESRIGGFSDASKILSSPVTLSWSRNDLYGLLWHSLASGDNGRRFREFLSDTSWEWFSLNRKRLYVVPRPLVYQEKIQIEKFHELAGDSMGRDRRRGRPYTWIPNHLADADGRVSPRSFLAALRTAAEETEKSQSNWNHALHYESIKRGVQEASKIRTRELQEDYPWVNEILSSLKGIVVPCKFAEVAKQWRDRRVLERVEKEVGSGEMKLPPLHIDQGPAGVRQDLESLGVFQRMQDGRVNIPDVFRVGYGLRRKGGITPVR